MGFNLASGDWKFMASPIHPAQADLCWHKGRCILSRVFHEFILNGYFCTSKSFSSCDRREFIRSSYFPFFWEREDTLRSPGLGDLPRKLMKWKVDKLSRQPVSDSPCYAGGICFANLAEHVVPWNVPLYIGPHPASPPPPARHHPKGEARL